LGGRDRLLGALIAAVGLAGLAVSVYLTFVHYSAAPLVCSTSGAIDCERVLTSGFAVIGGSGLPTSAAGIAWFIVSGALAVAQLAGRGSPLLARAQLAWSALGLATVIGLVFIEIVMLGAVCLWCTVAHALVVITFLLVITARQPAAEGRRT
jgi:uncharacterized membrane protein